MSEHVRWLLTVTIDVEVVQLAEDLRPLDVQFQDPAPIPVDDDEMILGCVGPLDLPRRLRDHPHPAVHGVHPDSPLQLY